MTCQGSLLTDSDLVTFQRFGGNTHQSIGLYNLIYGTWDYYKEKINDFLDTVEDLGEDDETKADWIGVIIENRSHETKFDRTLDLIRDEFSQFELSKLDVCFLYARTIYHGPKECTEYQTTIVNKALDLE